MKISGNLNMINPVFVPLEALEAEEDNEPPSLEKRLDLFACPCVCMDTPPVGLTSNPKFIRQYPFYSGTGFSGNRKQGQGFCIALCGPAGNVLTFFRDALFPVRHGADTLSVY
jgi:hypothetical protein